MTHTKGGDDMASNIVLADIDDADPYSAVIAGMKMLLDWGFTRDGSMSESEYEDLKKLEEHLREIANV
jgi:hypothetical protein